MRRMQPHHHHPHGWYQQMRLRSTTPRKHKGVIVTELHHDEHPCDYCGTIWNNARSADNCCTDGDGLTGYSPSRNRVSYRLSYD